MTIELLMNLMDTCLNFLCDIPAHIGWMIDGVLTVVLCIMLYKVIKLAVTAWKEWHEDDEEVEE